MAILPFHAEVEDHDGALLSWCERTWSYSRGACWQVVENLNRTTPVHLYMYSLSLLHGPRTWQRKVTLFEFLDQRHFHQWKWECGKQGKLIEIPEKDAGPVSEHVANGWPYRATCGRVGKDLRSWLQENCGREWHEWTILPNGCVGFVDSEHHALFTMTWC